MHSVSALKRGLLLKLSLLLVTLAGLLWYSHRTIVSVIWQGRQETEILNATGRQRMLVQQFVRQTNLALIGLSTSDWETLLEQRKLSAETSAQFEQTMGALLRGGDTQLGGTKLALPKVEAVEVRAALEEIASVWAEVKRASVRVLRSENSQLRNHPDLVRMQSAAVQLVEKIDGAVLLMQRRHVSRTDQLMTYQTGLLLGGLVIFVLAGCFVQRSIINPLARTIHQLDLSEDQHRNLYASAPVGLWQAELSEGRIIKANSVMANLLGMPDGENIDEEKTLFSLFPHGAEEFVSTLMEKGEVADLEAFHSGECEKHLLISARYYREKGFAEGAVVDISARKRAERELEQTHKLLVKTAHLAGMADVATNVLHNVGNVLNSLNISCTLAARKLRKSPSQGLIKAAAFLRESASGPVDPEKFLKLGAYLEKMAGMLTAEREGMSREMESMTGNIEHIRAIVSAQQSNARGHELVEIVEPKVLFEDALNVNSYALKRHKVNVVCDFEEIPEAPFEKHKVLQILVNLISNAKYALDEGEPPEKRLSLTLARPEPAQVVFQVADNGIGFNEEVATKLFRHGFTTRKEGHGFGLHSSVLAAKEMGGSLEARSQGLGRGAAFILTLPIRSLISQSLEPQVSSE